jgi:hypothetical protein
MFESFGAQDVEAIIGRPPEPLSPHLPFTPRGRKVLEHSAPR